eukprot:6150309-Lingulodinium_polyedra.AAC.1
MVVETSPLDHQANAVPGDQDARTLHRRNPTWAKAKAAREMCYMHPFARAEVTFLTPEEGLMPPSIESDAAAEACPGAAPCH